jgi:hypothetical protein
MSFAESSPISSRSGFMFVVRRNQDTGTNGVRIYMTEQTTSQDGSSLFSAASRPTQQATPSQTCGGGSHEILHSFLDDEHTPCPPGRPPPPPPPILDREFLGVPEDIRFMEAFVERVGAWTRIFDRDGYFAKRLPYHALSSKTLLHALLACGASHLGDSRASTYYDTAWTELFCKLQNPDGDRRECALVAVALNICETLSGGGGGGGGDAALGFRAKHLGIARRLIAEAGWTAESKGVAGACFWIGAGMEVLDRLVTDSATTVDPDSWQMDMRMEESSHSSSSNSSSRT